MVVGSSPVAVTYIRDFNKTKYMLFLIKDDELLKKYNEIWENVKNSIKNNSIETIYTLKNSKS